MYIHEVKVALFLLFAACTQPRSPLCKKVCERESECMRETSSTQPFDEKECIAACSVLEADQDSKAKVQKHYECVMSRQGCGTGSGSTGVLDCQ